MVKILLNCKKIKICRIYCEWSSMLRERDNRKKYQDWKKCVFNNVTLQIVVTYVFKGDTSDMSLNYGNACNLVVWLKNMPWFCDFDHEIHIYA